MTHETEHLIQVPETAASQLSDHLQHDDDGAAFHRLSTDTAYKAVHFIETYTGRAFYPLLPNAADFSIIDIAHHLSNECRYSGAPILGYSTAQHCCLLADYVGTVRKGSRLDQLQILMHDGAEAYLKDIPRPVKQFLPDYRKWDHELTMCLRGWMGLGDVPIPSWQDELDSRIIIDERAQVMGESGLDWGMGDVKPLGIRIEPWSPRFSEQQFLMRYAQYTSEIFGEHQYLRSGWGVPTRSVFTEFPFKTEGSDIAQRGAAEPRTVTDLLEVDFRGGVGRVALRSENGMMVRDTSAGSFPRPAWQWLHGHFDLTAAAKGE